MPTSFSSSVGTIANDALRDFQPDDAEKIQYPRPVFNLAMALNLEDETARRLALEACKTAPLGRREVQEIPDG